MCIRMACSLQRLSMLASAASGQIMQAGGRHCLGEQPQAVAGACQQAYCVRSRTCGTRFRHNCRLSHSINAHQVLGTSDSVSAYTSRSKLPAVQASTCYEQIAASDSSACCVSGSSNCSYRLDWQYLGIQPIQNRHSMQEGRKQIDKSAQRSCSSGRNVTEAVIWRMMAWISDTTSFSGRSSPLL